MQSPQPQDQPLTNLISEQIEHILRQKSTNIQQHRYNDKSIFNDKQYMYVDNPSIQDNENVYFDKQLTHLVVVEEFDFQKISTLLSQMFREDRVDTTVDACRRRWTFLHINRNNMGNLREKQKEQKRIKSVAAFSNPYSLYSVDQLIETLQKSQTSPHPPHPPTPLEPTPTGYNIFKDSFRRIQDMQEYNTLQAKMKKALEQAQKEVYEQKPLFFTPQYQKLEQFQVKEEELTADKVKQLMAYQIEMEKIGREMQVKKDEQEESRYEQIIRKRMDKEVKEKKTKKAHNADIEDDWDEYESD